MTEKYEKIVQEWNKWLEKSDAAQIGGTWEERSFTAFMCNAINMAVQRSSDPDLKRYFTEHARH